MSQPEPSRGDPDPIDAEPGRFGAIGPLVQLGRLLPSALGDLRTIAESVRILPQTLAELAAIRANVEVLNKEVKRMREGVDEIGVEVIELRESVKSELHDVGLAVHRDRKSVV